VLLVTDVRLSLLALRFFVFCLHTIPASLCDCHACRDCFQVQLSFAAAWQARLLLARLPFGGFSILGFLSLLGSAAIFQAGDSDNPAASRNFLILGLQNILSSLSISRKYIMRLPIRHLKVPNSSIKMTEPSKVLHIRNVGPEISEHDLRQLAQSFGNAQKIVMLRAKNQV
jgi:hypothetical protein